MKVLVNFANEKFTEQQKFNTKTAYKIGNFDKVFEYSPNDIDKEYFEKHKDIFSVERGCGLWLWKPYFILKTLEQLNEGDYLYYNDSGTYFLKPIDLLIKVMERDNTNVMCFENCLIERDFSSIECIDYMDCHNEDVLLSPQREGTYILLKNCNETKELIAEWLKYCENKTILSGGVLGPYCIAHREDQSIWSMLTKKRGYKAYRNPSQYAYYYNHYQNYVRKNKKVALIGFSNEVLSDYPTITYLYRKSKHYKFVVRVKAKLRYKILEFFRKKM